METAEIDPSAPSWSECVDLLKRLPELPLDARAAAVEVLIRNPSPGIRQQALRVGAAVLSDPHLTDFLRDDGDAVRRNAGAEIFRLRGSKSFPVVVSLLSDRDPDVVLQAVVILARMRDPRALEPLHDILRHADANVVQEAIVAIGQLGDSRSVPHLLPFLAADPWVELAAIQALGDLRAREAVPVLAGKLFDPYSSLPAAEALARIGGCAAFAALLGHWMTRKKDSEAGTEELVGLLAHVVEGLPEPPESLPAGMRRALIAHLDDASGAIRQASARCLLVLGAGPWDARAVRVLTGEAGATAELPPALRHRSDLLPALLAIPGKARIWGLRLAARYPDCATAEILAARLTEVAAAPDIPDILPALINALVQARPAGLGASLLDLYLQLGPEDRGVLQSALEIYAGELKEALAGRPGIDPGEAIVLSASLGDPAAAIRSGLLTLSPEQRRNAVGQLLGREDVASSLPWEEWLASDGALFPLAAEAAARYRLTGLLPALRERAGQSPTLPVLLALADLRDPEAVPLFQRLLRERPHLRPVALECLGKIGDGAARASLRQAINLGGLGGTDAELRIAYRALAGCAEPGDVALFRAAASHPDWSIRLAAAEVLSGACAQPENLEILALLATDPVSAVAHRALRGLES
jgi:HEAT repeat protein